MTGGRRSSSSRTCSTTAARNCLQGAKYAGVRVGLALVQRLGRGVAVRPGGFTVTVFLAADALGKPHRREPADEVDNRCLIPPLLVAVPRRRRQQAGTRRAH